MLTATGKSDGGKRMTVLRTTPPPLMLVRRILREDGIGIRILRDILDGDAKNTALRECGAAFQAGIACDAVNVKETARCENRDQ